MKTKREKSLSIVSVLLILAWTSFSGNAIYGATTLVNLQLNAGTITITSPASLTFTTPPTVSFQSQLLAEHFSGTGNYFTVNDLKGADEGYSTTLQISGNLTTGGLSIASGNVSFKVNSTTPILMSGAANPRVLIDAASASYQAMHVARTYIYRDTALNTGAISQYGQSIFLQVTIPAGQPAGAYVGTLVYTLIEN